MRCPNNASSLEVLVNGRPVTEYRHDGNVFIEGRDRSEFSLRMKYLGGYRDMGKRKLFVPSVDGLSIIDGKPASNDSRGFILETDEEIEVPGWMVNNETAASFFFSLSNKEPSYAEQMGYGGQNNGVIGVRVFQEKEPAKKPLPNPFPDVLQLKDFPWADSGTVREPDFNPRTISFGASASASALRGIAPQSAKELGAGWGEETDFSTTITQFEKGEHLTDIVIFYDTIRGLEALGVDVVKKKARRSSMGASPFPGDYCKSPK